MMKEVLQSLRFWLSVVATILILSAVFAWELGLLSHILPTPPRPEPTRTEWWFTGGIILLLSLNVGLLTWRLSRGTCPAGSRRATSAAGALGVLTLLCPVCLAIPLTVFGVTVSLAFLSPFLPVLRVIVLLLLIITSALLWPRLPAAPK